MLFVDIETAVNHIANEVELLQPLYEAIVNAVHAQATKIDIDINQDDKGYIKDYSIVDNGEGFTELNIKSFSRLWSNLKNEPGALGSGRLMYLRVFEYVEIKSFTGQKQVNILFNKDFDPNNIEKENNTSQRGTTLLFKNMQEDYIEKEICDIDAIKEKIFYELLPLFSNILKDSIKNISININSKEWITSDNIEDQFQELNLEHIDFELSSSFSLVPEQFTLFYNITEDEKSNVHQFYGAAGRKVRNFITRVKLRKLPNNASGIFCLTSPYLDVRVRDDRRDFKILATEHNPSETNPISFVDINSQLQIELNKIVFEKFPNFQEEFNIKKQNVIQGYPHLAEYIKDVKNATFTEDEIVDTALTKMRESFDSTQKSLRIFKENIIKKRSFDESEFEKITKTFTKTGRDQLASYIAYRQTILEMLETIINQTDVNKEKFKEKSIHELYMPQGVTSEEYTKYGTNVWIFDDKYMSYLYAASDSQIQQIRKQFIKEYKEAYNEEPEEDVNDGDRPDLVVFFSDEHEEEQKDVLIVEFKKYDASYHEKIKAINQMEIYASVLADTIPNVRSIFAYTIVEIDEKYRKYLTRTAAFHENSLGDNELINSYYKYNEHVKAHLHILSFDQVVLDAKKRNQVFLDILRENANS